MKHGLLRLGFGLAAVLLIGGCSSTPETPEEKDEDLKWTAIAACKNSVKAQLKDPESADFQNENAETVTLGQSWRVTGEVNANNSFGGKVGFTEFTCDATLKEDGETVTGLARIS